MADVDLQSDTLTLAIEQALSEPPSRVGMRLRTEQQIADRLGLSRWRLRESLNTLVERGIIARRRGSGTFLRRLPVHVPARELLRSAGEVPVLETSAFFEDPGAFVPPSVDSAGDAGGIRTLKIGLWCDLHTESFTARGVQSGLIRQINAGGHRLNIQSITHRDIRLLTAEELRRLLPAEPCDGHIVQTEAAAPFLEALGEARDRVPVVFYGVNAYRTYLEPVISNAGSSVVEQVFQIFLAEGYSRISMIRRNRQAHLNHLATHDAITETYDQIIRRHGLDYHAVEYTQSEVSSSVVDAMNTTLRLMERTPRPEAMFVSDDHLLAGVLAGLERLNLQPGRDIAVISITNRGRELPGGHAWSVFEFNPELMAQMSVETLLRMIQTAGSEVGSVIIRPNWRPGATHRIGNPEPAYDQSSEAVDVPRGFSHRV